VFLSIRLGLRALLLTTAAAGTAAPLSGCIVAAAGGAAAGGYQVLGQERAPGQQINDTALAALVSQSWGQFKPELAHDLDATVYQGGVLITGRVPSEDWRQEAVARTWKVDGVKDVYDEIEVGPDTHFTDEVRDAVISQRLKDDMIFDSQIKSINFTVRTENGVVYLLGTARSQDELNRVTDYARNIPNVRRVVSHMKIRTADTNASVGGDPATPPAAAAPPPSAETAPATPRAQIDATPLK
jgi:osmotically-inducible protein OsmY